MTAREIAAKLRAASAALPVELAAAEQMNISDLILTAERFSSGTATPATLRAADHPYAVRHGAFLNPGIINRQSGVFLGDWRTYGPQLEGTRLRSAIFNIDPKAKYLAEGTSRMVRRPLLQLVVAECGPRIHQRRRWAIQRALFGAAGG